MTPKLALANAVIVATQFNPSVFSQLWLVKNGVAEESEFVDGCLFSPVAAQIQARDFSMMVLPSQLQFAPRATEGPQGGLVTTKLSRIVELLPHTPFVAVGLNFVWVSDELDAGIVGRELFGGPSALYRQFAAADARLGAYLSRDMPDGCRLRLDVRPVHPVGQPYGARSERFQFSFNYQSELVTEAGREAISRTVGRWDEFHRESQSMVELAFAEAS